MTPSCLLRGGPEYVIEIGGVAYVFEMHDQCGPQPMEELSHKHEFWRAVSLWIRQGARLENGVAIWGEPREENRMMRPRDIRQHSCGEQMYRENAKEPWRCWPCELKAAQRA